jgi:glycosyltransferase involved in cell wall biosynthesis
VLPETVVPVVKVQGWRTELGFLASSHGERVTVLVMTYNHERFIGEALDSALLQETNFDYEILISEDYSTDRTREIVQEYARRDPRRIRLILSDHNLRSNEIVTRGIREALGEYIALLDGDDFWLDRNKLQKQVDFLDTHPECTVCFHQAIARDERGERPDWSWTPANQKEFSTLEDICMGNFIATGSTMFRRAAIGTPPGWYSSFFPITDWPLHVLNAEKGKIGYINEVMGVYRYHEGGAYSGLSQSQKQDKMYHLYQRLDEVFEHRYERFIKAGIFEYFMDWADEHANRGEREQAVACFKRGLTGWPLRRLAGVRKLARIWLKLNVSRPQVRANP